MPGECATFRPVGAVRRKEGRGTAAAADGPWLALMWPRFKGRAGRCALGFDGPIHAAAPMMHGVPALLGTRAAAPLIRSCPRAPLINGTPLAEEKPPLPHGREARRVAGGWNARLVIPAPPAGRSRMRTSGWGSRKYRPALTCAFWARLTPLWQAPPPPLAKLDVRWPGRGESSRHKRNKRLQWMAILSVRPPQQVSCALGRVPCFHEVFVA